MYNITPHFFPMPDNLSDGDFAELRPDKTNISYDDMCRYAHALQSSLDQGERAVLKDNEDPQFRSLVGSSPSDLSTDEIMRMTRGR